MERCPPICNIEMPIVHSVWESGEEAKYIHIMHGNRDTSDGGTSAGAADDGDEYF